MTPLGLRATGLAAIAAPLLLLASTLAYVARGEGLNDGEVGGTIQIWAFVAFGVAVVGLARRLEAAAPHAAVALTILGLVGVAGGIGFGIDSIQIEVLGTESLQETESSAVPLALQLPGVVFPLALAGLGVLLARHRIVPRAAGYTLAVGALLFPASRIPGVEALAIASDGLMLVALGTIGLPLLAERSNNPESSRSSAAVHEGSPVARRA